MTLLSTKKLLFFEDFFFEKNDFFQGEGGIVVNVKYVWMNSRQKSATFVTVDAQ